MSLAWQERAECGSAADLFNAAADGKEEWNETRRLRASARAVCDACPVWMECRTWGYETRGTRNNPTVGAVLGGLFWPEDQNKDPQEIPDPPPTTTPPPTTVPRPTAPPPPPVDDPRGPVGTRKNAAHHGTRAGYQRHILQRGGWTRPACQECTIASSADSRSRYGNRK